MADAIITPDGPIELEARDLSVLYGETRALKHVHLKIPDRQVVAFIGPSGCGKSTLLRCFNRMNDLIPGVKVEGEALFQGRNLYAPGVDAVDVRRRIGMVFQKPNPFPKSIRDNIVFGPRINGFQGDLDELVERSLRQAALWDEVKDRLKAPASGISGGQQQRLSIARALAVEADVLLMDEPTSSLDPQSTMRIEELIHEIKKVVTIVIVTHNMQQAARVSDYTAFFYEGAVVEHGATDTMFTNPREQRTNDYLTGRFG